MSDELVSLDDERAKKFLVELQERPFLALVLDGEDGIKLYTKGLTPEELERVQKNILSQDEED